MLALSLFYYLIAIVIGTKFLYVKVVFKTELHSVRLASNLVSDFSPKVYSQLLIKKTSDLCSGRNIGSSYSPYLWRAGAANELSGLIDAFWHNKFGVFWENFNIRRISYFISQAVTNDRKGGFERKSCISSQDVGIIKKRIDYRDISSVIGTFLTQRHYYRHYDCNDWNNNTNDDYLCSFFPKLFLDLGNKIWFVIRWPIKLLIGFYFFLVSVWGLASIHSFFSPKFDEAMKEFPFHGLFDFADEPLIRLLRLIAGILAFSLASYMIFLSFQI